MLMDLTFQFCDSINGIQCVLRVEAVGDMNPQVAVRIVEGAELMVLAC